MKMESTGRGLVGCLCVLGHLDDHMLGGEHLKVVEGKLCPSLSLPALSGHTVRHSPVNCSETGKAGKAWDLNQNHLRDGGTVEPRVSEM